MSAPEDRDLTPESAAPTDVAPLGRGQIPPHERTAEQDRDAADWEAIAADPDFKALLRAKTKFIAPMCVFFIVYYFALPIAVGFFPEKMMAKVGPTNLAYVFALSQFFVAWGIAWAYTRVAAKWDTAAAGILSRFSK